MDLVFAASFLQPIVDGLTWAIVAINHVVHDLGLSLVLLALLIRLAFWSLNAAQFKSMIKMQGVAPKLKALQAKFKSDPQKLQQETMALYKSEGVNPLAGCLPMLVQLPILFSVYWAVTAHKDLYEHANFLWVGSPLAQAWPKIIADSLAHPDVILLVLYMVSQYVNMRYTTMPPSDPAQAQQMKIMQFFSPLMLGFVGFQYKWPSAMVLYWLAFNLFAMAQQLYLLRRYHVPLSAIDSEHAIVENVPAVPEKPATSKNGAAKTRKKGAPKK